MYFCCMGQAGWGWVGLIVGRGIPIRFVMCNCIDYPKKKTPIKKSVKHKNMLTNIRFLKLRLHLRKKINQPDD